MLHSSLIMLLAYFICATISLRTIAHGLPDATNWKPVPLIQPAQENYFKNNNNNNKRPSQRQKSPPLYAVARRGDEFRNRFGQTNREIEGGLHQWMQADATRMQRKPRLEDDTIHAPSGLIMDKIPPVPRGRWWLDSLVKLFHTHPLHLTKYVRQLSLPTPDSIQFEVTEKNNDHTPDWQRHDQIWAIQKLRSLLASYRNWFSPKQWRQFLNKIPNPTFYDSRHIKRDATAHDDDDDVNLELFEATVTGIRSAVAECQHQMKDERWNCSQILRDGDDNALFGNVLLKGIPETGFVYSLISAALVRSISEACLNSIRNCPCNNRGRRENENDKDNIDPSIGAWQWQGCDHNVHYGRRFTRRLLEPMEDGFHIRFLMNLHNYRVGRRLVAESMEKHCRCHGTSGSCSLKTCYRRMPSMRKIGNDLKARYSKASQVIRDNTLPDTRRSKPMGTVIMINRWNQRTLRDIDAHSIRYRAQHIPQRSHKLENSLSLLKVGVGYRDLRPSTRELVFYERPEADLFCSADSLLHIRGTQGRLCNSTSVEADGCGRLCCNRGFQTQHFYALENCECKFVWCCRVECQKCLVLKRQEICN